MLDSILGFALVTMFLVSLREATIGFVLPLIEGHGLLKSLDGFGYVSTEHLRGHQALTPEAGPDAWILVVERHGLGIFLFDFGAELRTGKHGVPQRNLSSVKIGEQAVGISRLVIKLNGSLGPVNGLFHGVSAV